MLAKAEAEKAAAQADLAAHIAASLASGDKLADEADLLSPKTPKLTETWGEEERPKSVKELSMQREIATLKSRLTEAQNAAAAAAAREAAAFHAKVSLELMEKSLAEKDAALVAARAALEEKDNELIRANLK